MRSPPLIVAINCIDIFADREAVAAALFGWVRYIQGGFEA